MKIRSYKRTTIPNITAVSAQPSQSPDANPIESVWGVLKRKLVGKRVFTLKQLSRKMRKMCRSLTTVYTEKLMESMPERCQAILENDGDWRMYQNSPL